MGILVRVLEFFSGIAVAFAGYFIVAAQGWPEPLQSMTIEREVLGGLIAVLGLALIWSAFKPKSRPRSAAQAKIAASAPRTPLNFTAEAAAETASSPEPDVAAAPVLEFVAPAAAPSPARSPAPAPEQGASPGELTALLAEGDRLFAEGRADEALDPYSQALDLARLAHAAHPEDAQAARALAGALKSNADVYDEEGRLDTAIDLYEEALKLNRGLPPPARPPISDRCRWCWSVWPIVVKRAATVRARRTFIARAWASPRAWRGPTRAIHYTPRIWPSPAGGLRNWRARASRPDRTLGRVITPSADRPAS